MSEHTSAPLTARAEAVKQRVIARLQAMHFEQDAEDGVRIIPDFPYQPVRVHERNGGFAVSDQQYGNNWGCLTDDESYEGAIYYGLVVLLGQLDWDEVP